jgi:DNA-binding transcriptional regulator YhcF (GntR family)
MFEQSRISFSLGNQFFSKLPVKRAGVSLGERMPAKNRGGLPAYQRIQSAIRKRIESGELHPGDAVASERDLAKIYQVSLMTARHALASLERDGVVERRRSIGTFVAAPKIHFNKLMSYTEQMAQRSLIAGSKVLFARVIDNENEAAARLSLPPTSRVIKLERIRHAAGEPFALETCYLDAAEFSGLLQCGPRGLKGAGDALFHNNGDGTFTDVSRSAGVSDPNGYYGMGVVWADFNNSGRPDIYVANDSTPSFLYKNLGNGKFQEIGLESGTGVSEDGSEQASMGIAVGDYNHTGRPSIYTTNFSDEYDDLYRNDGNWNFTDVSYKSGVALPSLPYVKWGTAFADFDNDGWLDLIAVSGHVYPQVDSLPSGGGYREPKLFHLNQTDGTFCDASDMAGAALQERHVSRGLAVGDLFNDGNVDVVVGDLDGAPMILKNHGVPGRNWVSFDLAGTKSNRMAIGARVKVVAGGMTQTDEVHSGGSYLSQNDTRLHFGLGSAKKIDHVEIRWPSGAVTTLEGLDINQFYSVLEGSGVVPANRIRPPVPKGSRLVVRPQSFQR